MMYRKSSSCTNRAFRKLVFAAVILSIASALNIGGFKLNFGAPKAPPVQPSKEFLSLKGIQVQSVSTGAFSDSSELLKSKSRGPTLIVVGDVSSS